MVKVAVGSAVNSSQPAHPGCPPPGSPAGWQHTPPQWRQLLRTNSTSSSTKSRHACQWQSRACHTRMGASKGMGQMNATATKACCPASSLTLLLPTLQGIHGDLAAARPARQPPELLLGSAAAAASGGRRSRYQWVSQVGERVSRRWDDHREELTQQRQQVWWLGDRAAAWWEPCEGQLPQPLPPACRPGRWAAISTDTQARCRETHTVLGTQTAASFPLPHRMHLLMRAERAHPSALTRVVLHEVDQQPKAGAAA